MDEFGDNPMEVVHPVRMIMARRFFGALGGRRVPAEVAYQRMCVCLRNTCGCLRCRPDGAACCAACGCGKWVLAELRLRLVWAELECPIDPPLWGAWTGADEVRSEK